MSNPIFMVFECFMLLFVHGTMYKPAILLLPVVDLLKHNIATEDHGVVVWLMPNNKYIIMP